MSPPEPWHAGADGRGAVAGDPPLTRWLRRVATIPGLLVLTALDLALLPVLLLGSTVVDAVRRRPLVAVRFQLALAFTFAIHLVGLILLAGAWIVGGRWAGAPRDRERQLDSRVEVWLTSRTWRSAARLFGMHLQVEGQEALQPGPVVLMCRHASVLDALLPPVVLSRVPSLSLRYVIKRELLWDPCVDLLGHRLPNTFVRRGSHDPGHEIAHVAALADNVHPSDVVVIFPEGTRFTPAKREHILARLAVHDPDAFARGQRLHYVLPPHPGGPLALLERSPTTDVVFCAHTGLEGANHLRDLARGSLIGVTVRVRYWRAPAAEIPASDADRVRWLQGWWERIDAWVGQHQSDARAVA
jgi:1-acyl-sn-glycerol-3-phosphate acyltransferase